MKCLKNIFKKYVIKFSIVLCAIFMASCGSDSSKNESSSSYNNESSSEVSRKEFDESEDYFENDKPPKDGNIALNPNTKPNLDITVIGGGSSIDHEISDEIEENKITNIESLIYSAVKKNLETDGFTVRSGVASISGNDDYSSLGLYYYDDNNFNLFGNDTLRACGFVEIKDVNDDFYSLADEESIIYVIDTNDINIQSETKNIDQDTSITNVCTYNYENINSYHFVYQNKYVQYYQQTGMRIVYSTYENKKSNYDLSFGSLYDYDNDVYIYDESINETYNSHSGQSLFSDEDYEKLKKDLEIVSDEQLANGYNVDEYKIVYISPESIQAYLNSQEEDTFFGYSVEELTKEFGLNTALEYTSEGFKTAEVLSEDDNYNWKSFLTKVGIGSGIIIVGAILTPITGGATFGCALITISKVAVSYALTSAIGTMAIKTVEGMIKGKSITEALKDVTYSGLDAFANGFVIGAAVGTVGVLSGIIKPSACFVAGTPVVISNFGSTTAIENIAVGDYVWSYNQNSHINSIQKVTEIFVKEVNELIDVNINGKIITTTRNHPFYLPNYDVWVTADSLKFGDVVLTYEGSYAKVQNIRIYRCDNTKVYNFTVENNHTYYVGDEGVLVHNECTTIDSERSKAVKEAWKQEKQAVLDGTSKYNWSPSQAKEIIKRGKLKGYEGHHIVPVNEVIGTANEYLISDPNNIVFLSKTDHVFVHKVGDSFAGTAPRVVEVLPWMAKRVKELGLIIA